MGLLSAFNARFAHTNKRHATACHSLAEPRKLAFALVRTITQFLARLSPDQWYEHCTIRAQLGGDR